MPLTPAEKQRKYREKLKLNDPEKYAAMKKKNAERTKNKKKKIAECTEEEKQLKREKWRAEKEKKQVFMKVREDKIQLNLNESKIKNKERCIYQQLLRKNIKLQNTIDSQKIIIKRIQKQRNRYKAKCERLTKSLIELNSEVNSNKKCDLDPSSIPMPAERKETPCTKTNLYVEEFFSKISEEEKQKVKKQIFEHNVLIHSLTEKYNSGSNDDKKVLKSVVDNEIVNKYKLKSKMASFLGLKGKIRLSHDLKKKRHASLNHLCKFFEQDDVSRATAGKKEVKTYKKEKRQRRYLLQPMKLLYKKYKLEKGTLSYSTFKKYRPFHILPPKLSDRNTCACVKHENMAMKLNKLNSLGLTEIKRTEDILPEIMCDINNKDCAYNDCKTCQNKSIEFKHSDIGINQATIISWKEWTLQYLDYTNKEGTPKRTKRMIKKECTGLVKILLEKFTCELIKFKKHCYNILHQYRMYQKCLKTLNDETVAVHIDFSENYGCKHSTEVQSMHFGASKIQATLHTGVLYAEGKEPITFCTISSSNNHGPEAIWAHLDPILNLIRQEFPSVTGIHFFSDGPTSQYKQKRNFYFFEQITKESGFPNSTWNFFESAHGKGAADGVGGAVKRSLDSKVAYGENIPDAKTAFTVLNQSETKIKLFYIPETAIKKVPDELTPLPGTINLHQVRNTAMRNTIAYRDLSCFCDFGSPKGYCQCLNVKNHNLKKQTGSKRKAVLVPNLEKQKKKTVTLRKRAKLNVESLDDDSNSESDYPRCDTSEDETFEEWKENIVTDTDNVKMETKISIKPLKKSKGSFVVFKYDDKLYPGLILSVHEEGALISSMKKSLKSWKWPEKKDELLYSWDDIVGCIEPPKPVSKRGFFSVPELDDIDH